MIIDQTTEEILESLKAIEAKINAKTSQKSSKKSERAEMLRIILMFKEVFLANGYHLRRHQNKRDFQESVRSTERNLNNILTRQFGYSEEEISKASPQ